MKKTMKELYTTYREQYCLESSHVVALVSTRVLNEAGISLKEVVVEVGLARVLTNLGQLSRQCWGRVGNIKSSNFSIPLPYGGYGYR